MTESTPTAAAVPTVVLVHGAFADSSSWNGVIPALLEQGYPVVAAANPLRSLTIDADYVANVLSGIPGPIVLVGHSYGGSVITNAATGNSNVKALVFVAGFAPDDRRKRRRSLRSFSGQHTRFSAHTASHWTGGGNESLHSEGCVLDAVRRGLCQRVTPRSWLPPSVRSPMPRWRRRSGDPAWKTIPSWFIYGENDKNIPAAVQVFMAERAGAKQAIEVEASHVVMISQPQAVADVIMTAINAVS